MDYSILRCPITGNKFDFVDQQKVSELKISAEYKDFEPFESGLMDTSGQWFYPIINGIFVLLPAYAISLKTDKKIPDMDFDKKRVFDYYNEMTYTVKNNLSVYEDSTKWMDYRDVALEYIRNTFHRARNFYPPKGKYFLDIASGPIGFPEYMDLSEGYEYRICMDISFNALVHAKKNMEAAGKKGIYICGDITCIPLQEGVCDTVLSQHTLYHIPKDQQKTAVNELYRVAKPDGKIVIVYNWFVYSRLMNISLHIIQLYRLLRYCAGKIYVRIFPAKPRLYFYVHSPRWFKKSFDFSNDMEFYCWRSTNKYFLLLYVNSWLFQKGFLDLLTKWEDKYSKFFGRYGAYPAIVISKK